MAEHQRLGECLVKAHIITAEQLERALRFQKRRGGFLGQILLEMGIVSDKELCQAISEVLDVNCVSIDSILISEDLLTLIPESLAATCKILPLFAHGNTLYMAMENPDDTGAIQLVEFSTGMKVKPLVVPQCQLRGMLKKYYDIDASLVSEDTPEKTRKTSASESSCNDSGNKRLGELLVEASLISQYQLEKALRLQKSRPVLLGRILVEQGWISEEDICRVMSETLHLEYVHEDELYVSSDVVELVPESLAASCNIFPISVKHNVLYLAMENPLDIGVIQLVEFSIGMKVEPMIASSSQLQRLIESHYDIPSSEN